MYISSALGGGTTKLPGVVARATYVYWCTPSHRSDANASTRSSRRFWCSYHGPYHHQYAPRPPPVLPLASAGIGPVVASAGFIGSSPAGSGSTSATWERRGFVSPPPPAPRPPPRPLGG